MDKHVQPESHPGTLIALRHIVRALEFRFPHHNGPFEYGTRLAEETGELTEIVYKVRNGLTDETEKQRLLKELQDVLRVVYGIAGIYNLSEKLPLSLNEFHTNNSPDTITAHIAQISICSGELASAINHAEGMGIKKEKHGYTAKQRVLESAYALAQVVASVIRHFNIEEEFNASITKTHRKYKAEGLMEHFK